MAALLSIPDARPPVVLCLVAALWASPGAASAQGCGLGEGSSELQQVTLPGIGTIQTLLTPHFVCEDDVEIWADSAVIYSADAMSHLVGSVRYVDRTRELRSDEARYFTELGRLQAQGNVSIVDHVDGSGVENGDLVYLRITDFRDEEEMRVSTGADGIRPRATFLRTPSAPDSAVVDTVEVVVDPEPYTVVGDRIFMSGSSYLSAGGAVVIERDSLLAFADSAEYEGATDELVLQGSARVESAAYELVGRTITMATVAAETDEVRALREAVLTGDHLRLTAPQIVAHITDGVVEELVAIPLPSDPSAEPDSADSVRPVALAQEFELTADSLQLTSPRDVLERIFAAGTARSVSHARDSLNVESLPEIARTDWLEGDTIVVTFAPATSAGQPDDTTSEEEFEVERIVARLGARSLYRLAPSDTTAQIGVDPPAVHYVIGDTITILMSSGEVEGMEVIGQTQGVHLEPLGAEPPDTVPELEELQADTASASGANPAGDGNKPSEPAAPIREVEPWRRP